MVAIRAMKREYYYNLRFRKIVEQYVTDNKCTVDEALKSVKVKNAYHKEREW